MPSPFVTGFFPASGSLPSVRELEAELQGATRPEGFNSRQAIPGLGEEA
jgi:hypothetical protein